MSTRYFRTAVGWLRDTTGSDGTFSVPMESHEASFSEHYGTPVIGVEVEDDSDPRKEPFVADPTPEPTPAAPEPTRVERIAEALKAAPLPDDIKAALAGVLGVLED